MVLHREMVTSKTVVFGYSAVDYNSRNRLNVSLMLTNAAGAKLRAIHNKTVG